MKKIQILNINNHVLKQKAERNQIARHLLLRLNPAREGDVAAILNYGLRSDHAAVVKWLEMNQDDMDPERCLIKLRTEIMERLS